MRDKRISPTWSHLVLSSGGMAGLTYLGALGFLQENTTLSAGIKHIAGTSSGALFGFLFAIGAPMLEVEAYMRVYFTDPDVCQMDPGQFLLTFGVDDGEHLIGPARHFLKQILDLEDITFIELTKVRGISLIVCATCLNTCSPTYFSVDTTPEVSVLEAILASMAVPLLFVPVKIGAHTYIDGALTDNFPVFGYNKDADILGLYIVGAKPPTIADPIANAIDYARVLAISLLHRGPEADRVSKLFKYICVFDENPIPTFPLQYNEKDAKINLVLSEADIATAYSYGYERMVAFWESKCSPLQTPEGR